MPRKSRKTSLEKARTLLNYGLSKIETGMWFVIARTSAEADLPNSICKALNLNFEDVVALLLEAGILYSKQQASDSTTPKDRIDVKTDGIDTLNSHFLNLSIEHTYKFTKDAHNPYKKIYFIGRGKLGSEKPVYGEAAGADINEITYTELQRRQISEIREHVEAKRQLSIAASQAVVCESLYVETGLSGSAEDPPGGASLISPTTTEASPRRADSNNNSPSIATITTTTTTTTTPNDNAEQSQQGSTVLPFLQQAVANLNFDSRMIDGKRPPRVDGQAPVDCTSVKQASSLMRAHIVGLACKWGWEQTDDKKRQKEIAEAACKLISYDFGFALPIKGTRFTVWHQEIQDLYNGVSTKKKKDGHVEMKMKMGSKRGTYTDQVERDYPGYLHETFRQATKRIGPTASWVDYAEAMNAIARENNDADRTAPLLQVTRDILIGWFNKHKGTLKKPITRPILDEAR